jgi:hypothetical protein
MINPVEAEIPQDQQIEKYTCSMTILARSLSLFTPDLSTP